MGRRPSADARRRIIDAAVECFNWDGIRAISADDVIKRASVAKMTLYRYFPTKDALAAAFVREKSDRWLAWIRERVSKLAKTPSERVLAIFDVLEEWFKSDEYNGCPFHRSAAEFPAKSNPIHKEVIKNKRQLHELVAELVAAAHLPDASRLTQEILILMAGAEMMNAIEDRVDYARVAKHLVAQRIKGRGAKS